MSKNKGKWWTTVRVMKTYLFFFMVTMMVSAYLSFTQPIMTERPVDVQKNLYANVPTVKPGPPPTASGVEYGEALAYMTIPRFGSDWLWTVSEGTDLDTLASGPGHFAGTALPGSRGNTAYAAHRATHGDPFLNFDLLRKGDTVTLAQNGAEWTYEITLDPVIIEPDEGWVVKNMQSGRWLTLVTCWPKYGSEKRMYVRAKLTD